MKKSSKKVRNMLILPCICSMAFYMGSQVVTYTEASFASQQTVEATLSSATVFPKTIEKLTEEAGQHREAILNHYNVISSGENSTVNVTELEGVLAAWKQHREAIQAEIGALANIYTEIELYYNKVAEEVQADNKESTQVVFKYVQDGFTTIQNICSDVDKQVVLQKIDEHIQALEKQIDEEKTKPANKAQKQQPTESPTSSQQEQQPPKQEENKQENKENADQPIIQTPSDNQVPTQPEKSEQEASTTLETK
ncbi:DUF4047 domain-containing protein [Bacillus sp. S13(2024)]|uniref:DUF4047 domain-containing protein n=1 Tax=unclassified Bacillus (in: firmicutes) TaxID=185979 RepID=UPI003D19F288